ncbi:MAG: PilN domain-containing protein [Phycisphaeraceae bacterium]|nr:PilN domain-containing protein [Phycisphaeraceae bacterium]
MTTIPTNFLPDDYLEQRAQRRANGISLVLFVIVMAGVCGAFAVSRQQQQDVRRLQEAVNQRYQQAADRLEQLDQLRDKKRQMIHKARIAAGLVERVPRSVILAELTNNMPLSVSLLELNLDTKVVTPPVTATTALDKAKADRKEPAQPETPRSDILIDLTGVAPTDVDVAQFMTALSLSSLFTDLNLVFSQQVTIDQHDMRKFRVSLKIRDDVDARLAPGSESPKLTQNPMSDRVQFSPEIEPQMNADKRR